MVLVRLRHSGSLNSLSDSGVLHMSPYDPRVWLAWGLFMFLFGAYIGYRVSKDTS